MKALPKTQIDEWCRSANVSVEGPRGHLELTGPRVVITHRYPVAGLKLMVLGRSMAYMFSRLPGDHSLLWLREWDIWSPELELMGQALIRHVRLSYGIDQTFEDCPGMLFSKSEIHLLGGILAVLVIWQWDAYLISERGHMLCEFSHEETIRIQADPALESLIPF